MSESFQGKRDDKRSKEFSRGSEDFSAIYIDSQNDATPQEQGPDDNSVVISPPTAASSPASQQTRTDGPDFKDQVREIQPDASKPGAQPATASRFSRKDGPNFKGQGIQEGASNPGIHAVSTKASRNVSDTGPEFKDQVRASATSSKPAVAKSASSRDKGPDFKDQVRNTSPNALREVAFTDCDANETTESSTAQEHLYEENEDDPVLGSMHDMNADDPNLGSHYHDDPLIRNESESSSDNGFPLLEAELVNSIVAAQIVDEKLMRRNVCLLIVGLNILLVAGLGAGGYCLISGECRSESGDTQDLLISSSSSTIKYDCNVYLELNCQNNAGVICSEVYQEFLGTQVPAPTASECGVDLQYNISILNLEKVPLRVTLLELFRPEAVAVDLNEDKPAIEISPMNSFSVVYSVNVDFCEGYYVETLAWALLEASLSDERVCDRQGAILQTNALTPYPTAAYSTLAPSSVQSLLPAVCRFETSVACYQSNGTPCSSIVQREVASCSLESIAALEFSYVALSCNERSNQIFECIDYVLPLPVSLNGVFLECFGEEGAPLVVTQFQSITNFYIATSDFENLRGSIRCFLYSEASLWQQISFNMSIFDKVKEGHLFGALQFVSCGDAMCRDTIYYNTTVTNRGTSDINITNLQLCNDGCLDDRIRDYPVPSNPLLPGESYSSIGSFEFDNCFEDLSLVRVIGDVEAVALSNGEMCGNDAYCTVCGNLPPGPTTVGPTPQPPPTRAPDAIVDDTDDASEYLIFGLVASAIALELLLCMCVYMYYRRWKHRVKSKVAASGAKRIPKSENEMEM